MRLIEQSKATSPRPLFHHSSAELEKYLATHAESAVHLKTLADELRCRCSRPAVALRARVNEALNRLSSQKAADRTPQVPHASVATRPLAIADTAPHRAPIHVSSASNGVSHVLLNRDAGQQAVINTPANQRLIVDAGPGTGKTAVACARVAHLIACGVEASNIWLVSFTRTAVQELRNRITELVKHEEQAAAVRITTLDSQAWRMVSGFANDRNNPFRGYYETIAGAIRLLKESRDEVREYLASVEHLIVDEAQDLVGVRADLVELLINRIPTSAGVTVLCDEAQAIYGFSESEARDDTSEPLTGRLRSGRCGEFKRLNLPTVHRTKSPGLHSIFTRTRGTVLSPQSAGLQKLRQVREEIVERADGRVGMVKDQALNNREDTLVLFRRRVEVLMASSYLWGQGVRHRLRMSGLPTCIPPWIGLALWDHDERWLKHADFLRRFDERVEGVCAPDGTVDHAWRLLARVAGEPQGRVDMHLLRSRLAATRPPVEVCAPELGTCGPILGTIHASKGREAEHVHLMLPEDCDEIEGDVEEETRVLYVGATRARIALRTGEGMGIRATTTRSSNRCYRGVRKKGQPPRAQVEIGREGDIDLTRQVSESLFAGPDDALASQGTIRGMVNSPIEITGWSVADDQFAYHLRAGETKDAPVLGVLNRYFNKDLFEISKRCGAAKRRVRPSGVIRHIRCVGVRTVAVSTDDSIISTFHPPFCDTGIFLAPVITAFTIVTFYDV